MDITNLKIKTIKCRKKEIKKKHKSICREMKKQAKKGYGELLVLCPIDIIIRGALDKLESEGFEVETGPSYNVGYYRIKWEKNRQ